MASIPRNLILHDGCFFHVTWQCHNKSFYFKHDYFKKFYYDLLLKYKDKYEVEIYSYCIMSNHFHMAGKCESQKGLSDLMRVVNSLFARHFNKISKKRGQVCMDRFKSPLIQDDYNLLNVMKYIDLNPVRAKIVKHAKMYKYSSFRHYAYGEKDPLITDSPTFLGLDKDPHTRQKMYLEMVNEIVNNPDLQKKTPDYSTVYFIGDPDWVVMNYRAIQDFYHQGNLKRNSS